MLGVCALFATFRCFFARLGAFAHWQEAHAWLKLRVFALPWGFAQWYGARFFQKTLGLAGTFRSRFRLDGRRSGAPGVGKNSISRVLSARGARRSHRRAIIFPQDPAGFVGDFFESLMLDTSGRKILRRQQKRGKR